MFPRTVLTLALAALLAACAAQDVVKTSSGGFDPAAEGAPAKAQEILAAADWDHPVKVTLLVRQNAFDPAFMLFRKGVPYVMTLTNGDDIEHSFLADDFFASVVVKSLVPAEQEIPPGARLVSIKLDPGESRELSFIPLRTGYYPFKDGWPGIFYNGLHLAPFSLGTFGTGGAIMIK